jgi:two-component system LytT family response regulator
LTHSVLIVDDEPPARAKLQRFLAPLEDFKVVAEAGSVESAVEAIRAHEPEVLYLDIQLGTRSGFEVLEAVSGTHSPHVVFTTAYSEYAVKAFDIEALDYLLKPFDRERFLKSAQRVREALTDPDHGDLEEHVRRIVAGLPGRPAPTTQILIKDKARAYFVAVESIERISAAGNYVEIHAGGKTHLIREALSKFIAQLNPEEFIRVHRSHVVRVSFIKELNSMFSGDYELILKNDERLALSRRYKALLPASIRGRL